MKRVRMIATAAPALLGLTIPGVAHAAGVGHSRIGRHPYRVRPDTVANCLQDGLDFSSSVHNCFGIIGKGNDVDHMSASLWSNPGYALVGYKDVPGYPAKSKWRDTKMVGSDANYSAHWGPGCSFPTGTHVYGYTNYDPPTKALSFRIVGSNFTGTHKCA